ncbi:MAG TPA: helix-turn-helix domain-containing protein [Gaiellales bacterium]|jgi:excisionase family DNA binding protein|nr:helix-turn-helix domain-containing protein [Gaiellales bacterium]
MTSTTASRLLTTADLAATLQCHEETVYRHVARGMPHLRLGPKLRFDLDEVIEWMRDEACRQRDHGRVGRPDDRRG